MQEIFVNFIKLIFKLRDVNHLGSEFMRELISNNLLSSHAFNIYLSASVL